MSLVASSPTSSFCFSVLSSFFFFRSVVISYLYITALVVGYKYMSQEGFLFNKLTLKVCYRVFTLQMLVHGLMTPQSQPSSPDFWAEAQGGEGQLESHISSSRHWILTPCLRSSPLRALYAPFDFAVLISPLRILHLFLSLLFIREGVRTRGSCLEWGKHDLYHKPWPCHSDTLCHL